MKLYVDDRRSAPAGWDLARTVEEAVALIAENAYEEISLDFMIGDDAARNFSPVARFISSLPESRRPAVIRIHTASAWGARILREILSGYVKSIIII